MAPRLLSFQHSLTPDLDERPALAVQESPSFTALALRLSVFDPLVLAFDDALHVWLFMSLVENVRHFIYLQINARFQCTKKTFYFTGSRVEDIIHPAWILS